ncbi:sigma-70 family RNA polymerase sigma factor [Saccharomonospora sp. NPDC046836]|uniref:sigma-70 family RNA polymerase sigma factor n=1 Tax=Saccharomonospora sp. NPDC046836 TaxID=3156921 RepID=UPI0033F46668
MDLVEEFEAARPRLLSLAHRIVGSFHDAEDAVQAAWLRAQSADTAQLKNPDGWFTTVTARLCLDQLRTRHRRGEVALTADQLSSAQLATDEEFLRREDVSRALLVLLAELSPAQRVAYVLHDLFALPFADVATVLETTPASAKKLASRARGRLRATDPADARESAHHAEIVEAFLDASRGGDMRRLVTLLAPDVVRTADARLLPPGAATEVVGAAAVAEETRSFLDRIRVTVPVLVGGIPGAIIAPGGHPYAAIGLRISDGLIVSIEITPYEPGVLSVLASA